VLVVVVGVVVGAVGAVGEGFGKLFDDDDGCKKRKRSKLKLIKIFCNNTKSYSRNHCQ
jgi:hypothetical protein